MTGLSYNKFVCFVRTSVSGSNEPDIQNHEYKVLEVDRLANIKSAKKRILVNETKAARNKAIKSKVKTYVKKVESAVANNDAEAAAVALREATVEINKAGSKGVYHKNTCSRKISRLSKAVNKIS